MLLTILAFYMRINPFSGKKLLAATTVIK